jgi:sporulation protein YlmC with PRC-barrel domain
MKTMKTLVTLLLLTVFTLFAVSSFAADPTLQHRSGAATQTQMESQHMQTAADTHFRASELLGKSLKSTDGEQLGDLNDLIISSQGEINFALVSKGGVLGVGEQVVPVPWNAISRGTQEDELLVNIDKERFDNAPAYSANELDDQFGRSEFQDRVYGYYGTGLRQDDRIRHEGFRPESEGVMQR